MRITLFIAQLAFLAAALLITRAISTPPQATSLHQRAGIPNGYVWARNYFNGTINGERFEAEGTMQEVYAQYTAKNPDFTIPKGTAEDIPTLQKRRKGTIYCLPNPYNPKWKKVEADQLRAAMQALWISSGNCPLAAHACVAISCEGHAKMTLCNDNDHVISPTCSYLATYGSDMLNTCGNGMTGGQEFDTDGYNVIANWIKDCRHPYSD